MVAIKGRFDGKVFVPDEPPALQPNQRVVMHVEPEPSPTLEGEETVFDWIRNNLVDDPNAPADLAHEHDHYLYGTPKKGQ